MNLTSVESLKMGLFLTEFLITYNFHLKRMLKFLTVTVSGSLKIYDYDFN